MGAFGRASRFGLLLGFCTLLAAADEAVGADLGSGPPVYEDSDLHASNWTLIFTVYGWLPGLNGHTTVKGRTTDIDVGPFRVLEHIDGVPWMSYAEARIGRLSFYNDIVYAPLGVDASAAKSIGRVSLDATLGVDIEQAIVEVGATYEIAKWNAFGGSTAVDLLAGARYWHQQATINLALTGTLDLSGLSITRTRAFARAGDVDWVDPLVGLRFRHQLAPGHELMLRGDVGGFDAGSQFSWNVVGAYGFKIGVYHGLTYSGLLGYRALSVDYEKGSGPSRYEFDMIQHGPILGLVVSF